LLLPKPGEVLPLIKCDADLNLICGGCGAKLVEGVVENEIRNIVIRCPICESYNEVE
jgi:DNA-directed RNA polymerase subunit RPC12/RpoP